MVMKLPKQEAADKLGISLSTLNRWIRKKLIRVEEHMVGQQRRILVILEEHHLAGGPVEEPIAEGAAPSRLEAGPDPVIVDGELPAEVEVIQLRERVRGLEVLVVTLKDQNVMEQSRYSQIYQDMVNGTLALPPGRTRRRPWWRFWGRGLAAS